MLATIDFDDQPRFETDEVDDVLADRLLPAEANRPSVDRVAVAIVPARHPSCLCGACVRSRAIWVASLSWLQGTACLLAGKQRLRAVRLSARPPHPASPKLAVAR